MRHGFFRAAGLLLMLLLPLAWLTSCDHASNQTGSDGVSVEGTWTASVTFQTCTPAAVCTAAGFAPGLSRTAVMMLNQEGDSVQGTYTYQGAGIEANVSGHVNGNQLLSLQGAASNPIGSVTVHLSGTVNGSQMAAGVSHEITLIDGRSGTVTGTGTFAR